MFEVEAAADQFGFTAIAALGAPITSGNEAGGRQWYIDGEQNSNGETWDMVTLVHNIVAEVMSRGNIPNSGYKISMGFSNGSGLSSLLTCANFPVAQTWVAHVAGFIQDNSQYTYPGAGGNGVGPYSNCASGNGLTPQPLWTAMGASDMWISGLTPTPTEGLLQQFGNLFQ